MLKRKATRILSDLERERDPVLITHTDDRRLICWMSRPTRCLTGDWPYLRGLPAVIALLSKVAYRPMPKPSDGWHDGEADLDGTSPE